MHATCAPPSNIQGVFRRGLIKTWMDVVTFYTKSKLTYETDKLIAISAIARELNSTQQSKYLAGLWERDLVLELGWISESTSVPSFPFKDGKEIKVCDDSSGQEERPSETRYIAPSWSWASLEGAVTYPYTDEIISSGNSYPLIHGAEPWVKPETGDAYGRVTDGKLSVLAQIMEVKLVAGGTARVVVHGNDILIPGSVFRDDFIDGIFRPELEGVYLMPLVLCFFDTDHFLFIGVLLEPSTTIEPTMSQKVFKRIGALKWQATKATLERDPGLCFLLSLVGTIEWNSDCFSSFQCNMLERQRIMVI